MWHTSGCFITLFLDLINFKLNLRRIQLIITIRNHHADTPDSLNSTDKANRFAHTEQANINLKPIIYETDYVADLHNIFSNAVYYKHLPPR